MKIKWGIISTGRIASIFAGQLNDSENGELFAVASRTEEKAEAFAGKFNAARFYGTYSDLISDPDVDVIYIATPHPMHKEWAIKSADAKKNVLCEKPMTMNYKDTREVIEAAKRNNVFLMEAFHYRCHPQTAKVLELIRGGAIGEVKSISANFSFNGEFSPSNRTVNHDLGGGGILDVGCYCVSMVRLIAGNAIGKDFADPLCVKAVGKIGEESRIDEYSSACMEFPGGIIAQLSSGVQLHRENVVWIYGTKGRIHIPSPWVVSMNGGESKILIYNDEKRNEMEIVIKSAKGLFAIEADTVTNSLDKGNTQSSAMSWDDSLGNMRCLDMWRESIGLIYDMEKE
jgi:predicted dehydrogenase